MAMLPEDPEEWTDEQWLAWLAEGDAEEQAGGSDDEARPSLPSWRRGPLAAQFLAASMIGVAEVLYGKKEEPAIVIEASGEPPGEDGFEVQLDPERPDESVVVIRPWLLHHDD